MRITFNLGGKNANLRAEVPIPLDAFWQRIYDRLLARRQRELELEQIRQYRRELGVLLQTVKQAKGIENNV